MFRKSLEVSVEPEILRWTRESIGLSPEVIAKRLGLSVDLINKLESGEKKPTLKLLERLANIYKRPLAVFFLPLPHKELPIPTDFRCFPTEEKFPLSSKTRLVIRRVRRLQSLAVDLLKSLNKEIYLKIKKSSLSDNPETLAKKIRQEWGINIETQVNWKNENEAFNNWRKIVEKQGILVFQMSIPLEDKIRGFSLIEGPLPAIVVNSKDTITARIFSLFHEYSHLLLSKSGICNMEDIGNYSDEDRMIERFCNHFAGALLVPREDFLEHKLTDEILSSPKKFNELLYKLAKEFKVSQEVILRRMSVLGLINKEVYEKKRKEWQKKEWQERKGFEPDQARRCIREKGISFVSLVFEAYKQEKITYNDVADYLNLRFKYIPKVVELIGHGI